MRATSRLRNWLLFAVRTRRRAQLSVLLLAGLACLAWHGVRVLRAHRAYAAAERALAGYDFPAARERLTEAARLRPGRAVVWLLAAQAARRDGDSAEARAHLARYQRLAGGSTPEGRLEGLLQAAQRGQIEQDIHYLISLADSGHPATEQILEALAVGCVQVYHLDRAGFWIDQLLSRFPRNPVGRLLRAQMDDVLGRRAQAVTGCRELVGDFPEYAKARLLLAGLLFKAQQYPEATTEYQELRRRRPNDVDPLLGLARCLDRMGRSDDAGALIRELEERFPDSSEALLECGRFAVKQKRLGDALRLLRRAAQLAPGDHEVHYQLGLCLEQLGMSDEARHHLGRFKQIEADLVRMEGLLLAVVKSPHDPAPRREAGLICLRNGQTAEGLRWLQGALEVAPDDKATHAALADYYQSHGAGDRAQYHRRRAQ